MNHVNMEQLSELMGAIQQDVANGKITPTISGKWIFEDGQPQFALVMDIEGKDVTVEADMPTKLGGWGSRPGPLHYCLYGMASCYAFTFAAMAAMEGVALHRLEIEVTSHVNMAAVFGLSEGAIVERAQWKVRARADAPPEAIENLKGMAESRCPAVYCLTNPVPLQIDVEVV